MSGTVHSGVSARFATRRPILTILTVLAALLVLAVPTCRGIAGQGADKRVGRTRRGAKEDRRHLRTTAPANLVDRLRGAPQCGQDDRMASAPGPHELPFVLPTSVSGTVDEHTRFDLHRPDDADRPLPAVVLVPGPVHPMLPVRPRLWPVYQGYCGLAVSRGVAGVVVDQPFHAMGKWPDVAEDLAGIVASVRALDEVDAERIAIWAFSAGALLVGRWLADSPDWLRCLALSYPVLAGSDLGAPSQQVEPAEMVRPGRPLVLTRVGREDGRWQATVDRFLARAQATGSAVRVVEVPDGQHGFDVLDHTEQSRHAVTEAADLVFGHLLR